MHVAIVCRALGGSGSVASVALRQSAELACHCDVTLISESLPDETPWAQRVVARVPNLGVLRRFRHVPDEIAFARAARRALFDVHRRAPIDFVLAHSHAIIALAAKPFRDATGVKCGFFVHGDIFERPAGMYDPRLTAFYRWVAPRGYRAADIAFVLAQTFVAIAQRQGARDVEVVPNGIDPEEIGLPDTLSPITRDDEALRVLSVARLSVEKGFIHLIDAFAQLDVDATLDIYGGGPLEALLRDAIRSRGLAERVHLRGVLPRHELGDVYRQHHVFCLPTLSEPFGLVNAEALASGLPVIATNVGGVPEIVQHETNGLLVPPADPAALAAAITRVARDEPFRRALAANARSSVLPRLGWTSIGDRLAAAIRMRV